MDVIDKVLGSNIAYITYAVPFFFLLIGVEVFFARLEQKQVYRFNDSINDLSCGIMQVVTGVFLRTVLLGGYLFVYHNWSVLPIQSYTGWAKWAAALSLFLGVDFCYYWFHRISHQMNAPWAAHAVHHQSEEYNLAVALRQGTFQPLFSWIFYVPLALIGFPPLWYVAMSSFNTLYQFWIHTRLIRTLGPLEWIFNTPSHHRVHHGRNVKYLDKNHAGTLIIWDRLFGTFQKEEEEPVYGIVRPLASWNPLWANLHEYVELWEMARQSPYLWDRVKIWFMPPGWQPRGLPDRGPTPDVSADTVVKYDTRISARLTLYILVHFVACLVLAVYVLANESSTLLELAWPATLVVFSLVCFGGIFERRRWIFPFELLRLALLGGTLVVATYQGAAAVWGIGGATLLVVGSGFWFLALRGDLTEVESEAVTAESLAAELTSTESEAATV